MSRSNTNSPLSNGHIQVVQETQGHTEARDTLIRDIFPQPDFTRAAHYLREHATCDPRYGFVVLHGVGSNAKLVGSVRFSPLVLPNNDRGLMLGPLAIDPTLRGLGIGRALVEVATKQLKDDGWAGVLVIGDPGYFAYFGFSVVPMHHLSVQGTIAPLSLMGLEWQQNYFAKQSGHIERIVESSGEFS